jgi:hypothetical protein
VQPGSPAANEVAAQRSSYHQLQVRQNIIKLYFQQFKILKFLLKPDRFNYLSLTTFLYKTKHTQYYVKEYEKVHLSSKKGRGNFSESHC